MLPFILGALAFAGKAAAVVSTVQQTVSTISGIFGGNSQASAAKSAQPSQPSTQSPSALPESIQKAMNACACACNTAANKTATTAASQANQNTTENSAGVNASSTSASSVSNPTNASTQMKDGQAVFQNDNYIITAGDNNTVTIYNKKTKEVYEALGDPAMKIDGQQGFNFMGTTSLMLDDGTKVTLGKAEDGKGGTLASKLTITNGAYGSQITGIDTLKSGDLAVQESQGQGQALDQQVNDGVVIKENQNININNGRGFSVADVNGAERLVDQGYIDSVDRRKTKGEQGENLNQFDQLNAPTGMSTPATTATPPAAQNGYPSGQPVSPQATNAGTLTGQPSRSTETNRTKTAEPPIRSNSRRRAGEARECLQAPPWAKPSRKNSGQSNWGSRLPNAQPYMPRPKMQNPASPASSGQGDIYPTIDRSKIALSVRADDRGQRVAAMISV